METQSMPGSALTTHVTLQPCANASQLALGTNGTIPILPLSTRCITVDAPETRAELSASDCSDSPDQQFVHANTTICHAASGLCIGAEHAGTKAGTKLDLNTFDHTDNMRWTYDTQTKTILHTRSGLCMSAGAAPGPPPAPPVPASPSVVSVNDSVVGVVDPEYLSVAYDTAAWLGIPWEGKGPTTAPDLANQRLRTIVSHLAPARLRIGGGAGDCQT